MYFPIILNIWAVTVSMHFRGTWVITSLMLLANVYLLCWEYDRLKPLLPWTPRTRSQLPLLNRNLYFTTCPNALESG